MATRLPCADKRNELAPLHGPLTARFARFLRPSTLRRQVRFGSKADICTAIAMSALPPIADMCSATRMSALCQKRTYAVQQKTLFDHLVGDLLEMHRYVETNALAVFILITNSNLVGSWIGSSPGLAPLRMRSM